jgi:hypothetical protein
VYSGTKDVGLLRQERIEELLKLLNRVLGHRMDLRPPDKGNPSMVMDFKEMADHGIEITGKIRRDAGKAFRRLF